MNISNSKPNYLNYSFSLLVVRYWLELSTGKILRIFFIDKRLVERKELV